MTFQQFGISISLVSFRKWILNYSTDDEDIISLVNSIRDDECFPNKTKKLTRILYHIKFEHMTTDYGVLVIRRAYALFRKEVYGEND